MNFSVSQPVSTCGLADTNSDNVIRDTEIIKVDKDKKLRGEVVDPDYYLNDRERDYPFFGDDSPIDVWIGEEDYLHSKT